ncbi:MBL fold metallo-hydrolase [Gymnodinialimonas sp. 2305UL16-5]|uniref:MBL fold metallo-hydrolase n=1 Tax=Gymnodinialimonas mytili TaxID=3126503 RepID=UPI0030B4189D
MTHGHYDHADSAAALSRALNANVLAHPVKTDLLRQGKWRRPAKLAPTLMGHLMTRLIAKRFPDRLEAIPEIKHIQDNGALAVNGLRTLTLPGRSAGQVGFGIPQPVGETVWIVGDVIMTAPRLDEPNLYEDRSGGLSSITALAKRVQPGDLICPGQGAPL